MKPTGFRSHGFKSAKDPPRTLYHGTTLEYAHAQCFTGALSDRYYASKIWITSELGEGMNYAFVRGRQYGEIPTLMIIDSAKLVDPVPISGDGRARCESWVNFGAFLLHPEMNVPEHSWRTPLLLEKEILVVRATPRELSAILEAQMRQYFMNRPLPYGIPERYSDYELPGIRFDRK